MSKTRTAGDGMESVAENERKYEYKKSIDKHRISTSSRLVQVFPTTVLKSQKKTHVHSKNPKFVPYEPYPAAVKPIVPRLPSKSAKKSKNNMDINTLISQMSQMNTNLNEFKPRAVLSSTNKKITQDGSIDFTAKAEMQKRIDDLSSENEILRDQLQQQAQVNKELKTMLVASMGEDLETQVQSLTEDKKHLANALLNSAQHLSTHQEQTEWLAGQCEVWRSKFLASSLMVEELANWKKSLNEKTEKLQQVVKQLLDERCRARDMMFHTYRNLYSLHENWLEDLAISEYMGNKKIYNRSIGTVNLSASAARTTNLLDLASVNLKLSENVSSGVKKQDISQMCVLPTMTDGEIRAEEVMAMPLDVRKVNEEPVSALVNHAHSNSNKSVTPVASCTHCNGKVQLL